MTLPEKERVYIAIDLKSFYASVECVERDWILCGQIWWWRI